MKKTILFYLILINILLSCKSIDKTIEMEQLKTDFPVVILLSKKYEKIKLIEFPIKIKIYNPLLSQKTFSSIEYDYNPYTKGIGEVLHIEKNGSLKEIRGTKHKNIYPYQSKEYIIYSSYRIDSSTTLQKQLKPYVEKMLNLSQDTLAIGTVQEFKQKHKELLKQLTTGDSIYLRVLNAERNGYEKGVKIPVKF